MGVIYLCGQDAEDLLVKELSSRGAWTYLTWPWVSLWHGKITPPQAHRRLQVFPGWPGLFHANWGETPFFELWLQEKSRVLRLSLIHLCWFWVIGQERVIVTDSKHNCRGIDASRRWPSGKESACQYRLNTRCRRRRFDPWVDKIPWRTNWQPTAAFLPGNVHVQRNLVGYTSWGCKELDTTEHTWEDASPGTTRKGVRPKAQLLSTQMHDELLQ